MEFYAVNRQKTLCGKESLAGRPIALWRHLTNWGTRFDGTHPSLSHVWVKNIVSLFVSHSPWSHSEKSLRFVRRNKNLLSRRGGKISTVKVEVSQHERICSFSTRSQVAEIALWFLGNLVSVKISIRIWANVQLDVASGSQAFHLTRRYGTIYDPVHPAAEYCTIKW